MTEIILDGLLLERLIKARFPRGSQELIARWDASGEGLNPSTIYRWTRGQLPRTGDDLLRLAGLLDVDPFALLTLDRGPVDRAIDRLLSSFQGKRGKRLDFVHEFVGRQAQWPPGRVAQEHFGRGWCRATFQHDPAERANYYAVIRLDGELQRDLERPQTYHFAFRQPGRFANRWLGYGHVIRMGSNVRLFQISGHAEACAADGPKSPTLVETFFGPGPAEFCVASLHRFTAAAGPAEEISSRRVRFPG